MPVALRSLPPTKEAPVALSEALQSAPGRKDRPPGMLRPEEQQVLGEQLTPTVLPLALALLHHRVDLGNLGKERPGHAGDVDVLRRHSLDERRSPDGSGRK